VRFGLLAGRPVLGQWPSRNRDDNTRCMVWPGLRRKLKLILEFLDAGIGTNRIQFRLDGEPTVKLGVVDGIALHFEYERAWEYRKTRESCLGGAETEISNGHDGHQGFRLGHNEFP